MHSPTFTSLIPALLLFAACGTPPNEGDSTGTGTGTDTDTGTSAGPSTDDPTTQASSGTDCVPGQSSACTCTDGMQGAQVCNAAGSGYEPCVCTGSESSANTGDISTSEMTTAGPTGDPTTNDGSSTGDVSASAESSTGGESTTGGDAPYGPCPGGDGDCLQGEICIEGENMQLGPWTICTPGECQSDNDCDATPDNICSDAPGDGMPLDYCLPQTCDMQNPCPMGMDCYPSFGMGLPSVCLWPN